MAGMFVVRYVAHAALAVWVGGMVVLGLLARSSTCRLLADDPVAETFLGIVVNAEILRLFHWLAYACGAAILVCLSIIKLVGPPPRAFKLRAAFVSLMLAIAIYSHLGPTRELARVAARSEAAGRPDQHRLNQLRITATALGATELILGLVLFHWYVRE
ncbi:MAG: hypothetical protein C5B57_00670 [Blastocatellia bacterium]|nr:MAG: hypothetical protein C5B57_00670 [Blastocatellia bacterium]